MVKAALYKMFSLLLCLSLLISCFGFAPVSADDLLLTAGGSGSESDPYRIASANQLVSLSAAVNAGNTFAGSFFCLTDDIILNDISDASSWNTSSELYRWSPIGNDFGVGFAGTFDGGCHSVKGVYISEQACYQGLFGFVDGGTVKNLTVCDSFICGADYVGGVVGCLASGSVIGCESSASVSGHEAVGGVVGDVEITEGGKSATVSGCSNAGSVAGQNAVGGVVGMAAAFVEGADILIEKCSHNGAVNGYEAVGGIVGSHISGVLKISLNEGTVNGTNYVGGIAGYNGGTVDTCLNSGNVIGLGSYTGGLVGWNAGTVTVCLNEGTVSGGKFGATGGAVGHNGSAVSVGIIINTVSKGNVTGDTDVGAFVGEVEITNSQISNCYYLQGCAVDGKGDVQNGVGGNPMPADVAGQTIPLTEAAMGQDSSFVGFDFENTWQIDGDTGALILIDETDICNHNYSLDTVYPTCLVDGSRTFTCAKCGYTYFETIPATGHTLGEWHTTVAPTLYVVGEEQRGCSECDYIEAREIAKLIPVSVDVKTLPSIINYTVGDSLDTTGLVLVETYNDGTTADITEGFSVTPETLTASGIQTITVTLRGNTATFTVTVNEQPYRAIFVADGNTVGIIEYTAKTTSITPPDVPQKTGYTGEWEPYTLAEGGITVNAVYTPISYTATFVADGVSVGAVPFTVESEKLEEPPVPPKAGYTGSWESYSITAENITVNALYVPITYTAAFVIEGETVGVKYYTVEDASLIPPLVPDKKGYVVSWEEFELVAGGITVNGSYVPATYTVTFIANGQTVATREYTLETECVLAPEVPSAPYGFHGRWMDFDIGICRDIKVYAVYEPPILLTSAYTLLDEGEERCILFSANFPVMGKTFISSDESVATVDSNGNITAVNAGECTVTVLATGEDEFGNSLVAESSITVAVSEAPQPLGGREMIKYSFHKFFRTMLLEFANNLKRICYFISVLKD